MKIIYSICSTCDSSNNIFYTNWYVKFIGIEKTTTFTCSINRNLTLCIYNSAIMQVSDFLWGFGRGGKWRWISVIILFIFIILYTSSDHSIPNVSMPSLQREGNFFIHILAYSHLEVPNLDVFFLMKHMLSFILFSLTS